MCRGIVYRYSCGHESEPKNIDKCIKCKTGKRHCRDIDRRFIEVHGQNCPLHWCLFKKLDGRWICCCCKKFDPEILVGKPGNVERVCMRELYISNRMFYCGHIWCDDCIIEDDEDWEKSRRSKVEAERKQKQQEQQQLQRQQQQPKHQEQPPKEKPQPQKPQQQQPQKQQQPGPEKLPQPPPKPQNPLLQTRPTLKAAMRLNKKSRILRPMARPGHSQLQMERKRKAEDETEKEGGAKRAREQQK